LNDTYDDLNVLRSCDLSEQFITLSLKSQGGPLYFFTQD